MNATDDGAAPAGRQPGATAVIPADYGEGFHVLAGMGRASDLEVLEVSFGFSRSMSRTAGQPLMRFAIFNAAGELGVVCGLRGLVQGSEFSSLIARLGYERRSVRAGEDGGYDFAYGPGVADDPTETRGMAR